MKKVGLALSGGAAKGLSEIGVIKVLEKNNIPINYVSGTSIGSIVGALYCSGMNIKEMERIALKTNYESLLDFTLPKQGILKGNKIESLLRSLIKNKKFSQLKIPLAITAVDLKTGNEVTFKKGDVATAVRASIAIPGIFYPLKHKRMVLVDGGVLDLVPVESLKNFKADVIIATDLSHGYKKISVKAQKKKKEFPKIISENLFKSEINSLKENLPLPLQFLMDPTNVKEIIRKYHLKIPEMVKITIDSMSIMNSRLGQLSLQKPYVDVIIKPYVKGFNYLDFDKAKYLIKRGEEATQKQIRKIKRLIR